jgi:CxxC-x17-CxxC domain-containing protein
MYNSSYTPRQMFPATCSDCGKATQVPFEPRNSKPVYCSDCYRKVRAA